MPASLCRRSSSRSITSAVLPALLVSSLVLGPLASSAEDNYLGEPDDPVRPGELCTSGLLVHPLAGDQEHVYDLATTGAFLLRVEQQQLDVVLELEAPDGQRTVYDQPTLHWGEELIHFDGTGQSFRLYVRPASPGAAPGTYAVRCVPASDLTPDEDRAGAALARAGRLRPLGTQEGNHQALAAYVEALGLWRSLEQPRRQAETLHAMALLRLEMGETETAVATLERSLALWTEVGERWRVAAVRHGIGYARMRLGELGTAREEYQRALQIWQELGLARDEAVTRNNLCLIAHHNGDLVSAASCYSFLRTRFQGLGDRWYEALMLNNLGGVYDLQDLPDEALQHYHAALELRREFGDALEIAQTLNNIAVVHRRLGEFEQALLTYEQALDTLPATEQRLRSSVLYNIGIAYLTIGEPRRGRAFLEPALELRRQTGHRVGEILTLNLLGRAHRELRETDRALDFHRQAVAAADRLGRDQLRASSRSALAETLLDQGNTEQALAELELALDLYRKLNLRTGESTTLRLLGIALAAAGRHGDALAALERSTLLHRQRGDRLSLLRSLGELATVELDLLNASQTASTPERLASVDHHLREALNLTESLRLEIIHPRLQATFFASRAKVFELAVELYALRHRLEPTAGHHLAALEITESSRARSLLDLLARADLGTALSTSAPQVQELLDKRRQLQRQLHAVSDRQESQATDASARQETEQRLQQLLANLDLVEARLRRLDPAAAAPAVPPLIAAGEIAALLDPETVLLEFALGDRRSYVWRVSVDGVEIFELPPRQRLEALAREAWKGFKTVEAGGAGADEAARMTRLVLAPALKDLGPNIHRLAIVPDGALHYLPFAALPHPDQGLLLEHYEVVQLVSVSALALQRQRAVPSNSSTRTAIFADPVFDPNDTRCQGVSPEAVRSASLQRGEPVRGTEVLPRLPASRQEAELVAALQPPEEIHLALGFEANRNAVLQDDLTGYRILHFATHGHIDTLHPELSGLILSRLDEQCRPRNGFLGLPDLYHLRLNAELVVLSGCSTALGEEIRGEGLLGLTHAFFHAGSPRVLSSMWQVQDRATSELMERFYRALWQGNLRPAAALRAAQLSLRSDPRRRHPYFWAAFVLQGDWL